MNGDTDVRADAGRRRDGEVVDPFVVPRIRNRVGQLALDHSIAVGLLERDADAAVEAERRGVAGIGLDLLEAALDRRDEGHVHTELVARQREDALDRLFGSRGRLTAFARLGQGVPRFRAGEERAAWENLRREPSDHPFEGRLWLGHVADGAVHEIGQIAAATRMGEADQVADQGSIRALPALVGRDASELEQFLAFQGGEIQHSRVHASASREAVPRLSEPVVHSWSLDLRGHESGGAKGD